MALYRPISTLAVLMLITLSTQAAAAPRSSPQTKFTVSGNTFTGTPKLVCVIEGQWSDGQDFRYEAWDDCEKMSIQRVNSLEFRGSPSLGQNDHYSVSDIPPGSEVFQISNEFSSALLFRDQNGIMREILIGD